MAQRRKYECEIWRRPDKENELYLRGDFYSKFLLRNGAIGDRLQIQRANGVYRISLHRSKVIATKKSKGKADLEKVLAKSQLPSTTDLASTEGNAIAPESEVLEAAKGLRMKKHTVLDGSVNAAKRAAPVECKGIVGSIDRCPPAEGGSSSSVVEVVTVAVGEASLREESTTLGGSSCYMDGAFSWLYEEWSDLSDVDDDQG